jgi:hypothetical protein
VRTLDRRTALILPARRGAIAPATLAALQEYVARGGHLIVESERYSGDDPCSSARHRARRDRRARHLDLGLRAAVLGPLASRTGRTIAGSCRSGSSRRGALWVFFSGGEALSTEGGDHRHARRARTTCACCSSGWAKVWSRR